MKEMILILKLINGKNIEKIRKEMKDYINSSNLFGEVNIFINEKVSTIPFYSKNNNLFSCRIQTVLDFVKIKYM